MTSPSSIIRLRQHRRKKARRSSLHKFRRFALILATLFSLGVGLSVLLLTVLYNDLTQNLPSLESLPVLLDPPNGILLKPTQFYDRTGTQLLETIENPVAGRRNYVPLESIPKTLQDAIIVAHDPTFWSNPGFTLEPISSTPTLAQKLAAELLFWYEPQSWRRNLRERILAGQIVQHFGHEKVLEWYINSVNFGARAFGVEGASQLYFGKSATELTVGEAAMLAAVSQAPDLNPFDTPELAFERQQKIIQEMINQGMVRPEDGQRFLGEIPQISPHPENEITENTAFINFVLEELDGFIPRERLERGGFQIITTLNHDFQGEAICATSTQLSRLSSLEDGLLTGELESCESARLLPSLIAGLEGFTTELRANVVVIDPRSGQILSMVTTDFQGTPLPDLGSHAPGSLLAPYVYLTAFTRGSGPASLVWDIPQNLPPGFDQNPNKDREFHGPTRMRIAMANDYLVPTLQLLNQLGPENVWKTAAQLGLPSLDVPAGSAAQRLLVEGGKLPLLEAVHAFGVFSTQGVLLGYPETSQFNGRTNSAPLRPTSILKVMDETDKIWFEEEPPDARPMISPQLSFLITHILSDEAARWPSFGHPNFLEVGRPVGVKTGQTIDQQNAWTIGFTPELVVGVWSGFEGQSSSGFVPADFPASIWHALIKYMTRELPPNGWGTPPGISNIDVCDPSGMLPTQDCPTILKEVFMPGNEPTQFDSLFRKFQINRETGQLATIFTPQGLIDDRVYMVPPPEAAEWAKQAGFPTPPETYDLVSAPLSDSENVRVDSPKMFASVSGEVEIKGTVAGAGFQSYQVQVGQGLNPQQWIQIDDEKFTPIEDGVLTTWNTEGLSGLYALRLLVLREERRVETATIQVTVDNQAPEVSIVYPDVNQQFSYPQDKIITMQASASDDLALEKVEFYVDNRLVASLARQPFTFPWQVTPGEHTLRVEAIDLAGNIATAGTSILVSR